MNPLMAAMSSPMGNMGPSGPDLQMLLQQMGDPAAGLGQPQRPLSAQGQAMLSISTGNGLNPMPPGDAAGLMELLKLLQQTMMDPNMMSMLGGGMPTMGGGGMMSPSGGAPPMM